MTTLFFVSLADFSPQVEGIIFCISCALSKICLVAKHHTKTFKATAVNDENLCTLEHLQEYFYISLSKLSFGEPSPKIAFLYSPIAFLYLVYTLESYIRYLSLVSEKCGMEDGYIWITI